MNQYICFDAEVVKRYFYRMTERFEDSYISQDAEHGMIADALEKGYSWIRTDGDMAVFEKKDSTSSLLDRLFSLMEKYQEKYDEPIVIIVNKDRSGSFVDSFNVEIASFPSLGRAIGILAELTQETK